MHSKNLKSIKLWTCDVQYAFTCRCSQSHEYFTNLIEVKLLVVETLASNETIHHE